MSVTQPDLKSYYNRFRNSPLDIMWRLLRPVWYPKGSFWINHSRVCGPVEWRSCLHVSLYILYCSQIIVTLNRTANLTMIDSEAHLWIWFAGDDTAACDRCSSASWLIQSPVYLASARQQLRTSFNCTASLTTVKAEVHIRFGHSIITQCIHSAASSFQAICVNTPGYFPLKHRYWYTLALMRQGHMQCQWCCHCMCIACACALRPEDAA